MGCVSSIELRIIEAARQMGSLPELCDWIEYYPEVGRVDGHWRAKWPVLKLVELLTEST